MKERIKDLEIKLGEAKSSLRMVRNRFLPNSPEFKEITKTLIIIEEKECQDAAKK